MSLTMEELLRCEVATLKDDLETVKRERDALKHDFLSLVCTWQSSCSLCKHFKPDEAPCKHTVEIGAEDIGDCFEWRGLCYENGGAEDEN